MVRKAIRIVRVRIGGAGGRERVFEGREAWALSRLLEVGDKGLTSIDEPGVRLAHYVMKIRRAGIAVEMVREPNTTGAYGGNFGRYFLRTPVTVLETVHVREDRSNAA
jgi:hypothetical protein